MIDPTDTGSSTDPATPRVDCLACGRPEDLCICSAIRPVHNRTPVTIVQHPRERRHPFNTVRIARLALQRVDVRVAWDVTMEPPPLPPDAALLFPGPDAEALDAASAPSHLVVLDGTWPQARALYRANPWLHALRHVQLEPDRPSAYAIRREPAAHCLSSIESITAALQLCEPDNPTLAEALRGFEALVSGQVAHQGHDGGQPRRARRQKAGRRQILAERWSDAVIVYAETTGLGRDARASHVLQLAAFRPATGERFDQLAAVPELPNPCVLDHMGLASDLVHSAPPLDALAQAWASFVRPDDLFLAWSDGAARTAFERVGFEAPVLPLKSMYCNLRKVPSGRPDQVLEREGVQPVEVAVRGRAATRLGNAAALAGWLRGEPDRRR